MDLKDVYLKWNDMVSFVVFFFELFFFVGIKELEPLELHL